MTLLPPGSVVVRASEAVLGRPLSAPHHPPGGYGYRPTVPEYVVFTAPCDLCGRDATWQTEREDDRARVTAIECTCGGPA